MYVLEYSSRASYSTSSSSILGQARQVFSVRGTYSSTRVRIAIFKILCRCSSRLPECVLECVCMYTCTHWSTTQIRPYTQVRVRVRTRVGTYTRVPSWYSTGILIKYVASIQVNVTLEYTCTIGILEYTSVPVHVCTRVRTRVHCVQYSSIAIPIALKSTGCPKHEKIRKYR